MTVYLHVVGEDGQQSRFEIDSCPFVFGRHKACDGQLDEPSVSSKHFRIVRQGEDYAIEDLKSTNGVKFDGVRIERRVLADGDRFVLGKVEVAFSSLPEPPPPAAAPSPAPVAAGDEAPGRSLPVLPLAVGGGLIASLAVAAAIALLLGGGDDDPPADEPAEVALDEPAGTASGPDEPDDGGGGRPEEVSVAVEILAAERDLARHRPAAALERLRALGGAEASEIERRRIEELLGRARPLVPATAALDRALADLETAGRTMVVALDGRSIEILGPARDGIRHRDPDLLGGDAETTSWGSLAAADLLRILESLGVAATEPLSVAAHALAAGDEERGRSLLARALAGGASTDAANEVYRTFGKRAPPPGGWVLVGDRLGTREELAALRPDPGPDGPGPDDPTPDEGAGGSDAAARAAEVERIQRELAGLQRLEDARRAARDGFDNYLATIDIFILNLDFAQAIRDLETLSEELERLGLEDLLEIVNGRLFDARGLAGLFGRLFDDINHDRLARRPTWTTASKVWDDVRLTDADGEGVVVVLEGAEIQLRWRVLDPARLIGFFDLLRLSIDEQYFVGKLCLDRGLENAAMTRFVQVARSGRPDLKRAIDRSLAEHLGVGVPEGGFVVHGNELIHPEVKSNLEKGLVLFRGQWMTAEELAKAKSGLVQYRGEWIPKDEKEQLEALEREESQRARSEGFVKVDGKWVYNHQKTIDGQLFLSVGGKFFPADKAREMRSQWENAWTLTTEHFDLKTNMTDAFATEWADFMEAAWDAYAEYFGTEFDKRLELYAFRTYDDYRNYCKEVGRLGNLKAGGFADPSIDRGVGWQSGKNMNSLLWTMIHEGAHLYHFNAFKTKIVPSWYAEGTATQFEGYSWDGETRTLTLDYVSRGRLGTVKGQVLAGKALSLDELIRGNAGQSINESPAKAQTFYATAWAFKNFLDRSPDPVVRRMANEFKREMESGEFGTVFLRMGKIAAGQAPLERVFGSDLSWLQKKWEDHVRGIK